MDGKDRAPDNVMIGRFRRTVKYDDIHILGYESMNEFYGSLSAFFPNTTPASIRARACMRPEQKYRGGLKMESPA